MAEEETEDIDVKLQYLSAVINSNGECLSRLIILLGGAFPVISEKLGVLMHEWGEVNKSINRDYKDLTVKKEGGG